MANNPRRPSWARALASAAALVLSQLFLLPGVAHAQSASDSPLRVTQAGRPYLDSLATAAARDAVDQRLTNSERARSANTASAIRARLQQGDFRVGDRIEVFVRGDTALTNSFVVREGVVLALPTLPEIPLTGLLRSEAEARIRSTIAAYIREPDVKVNMLVRVGVLGQVVRPGYYQLASDALLSDALMVAGGPLPTAATDRMTIRHGDKILLESERVREFVSSGATLSQAGLHSGDEVVIDQATRKDWAMISQIAVAIAGVAVSVLYATHHR